MLEDIVFLVWDVKLAEMAVKLKQSIGTEGEAVHIWGRDIEENQSLEDGGEGTGHSTVCGGDGRLRNGTVRGKRNGNAGGGWKTGKQQTGKQQTGEGEAKGVRQKGR